MDQQHIVTQAEMDAVRSVRLPEETKREIILRFKQGQTKTEIKRAMGLTTWSVHVTLDEKAREHGKKQSLKYRGKDEPDYKKRAREAGETPPKEKPSGKKAKTAKPKPAPQPSFRARAMMAEESKKFNEGATEDDCIDDLRAVQKMHPFKFIDRNYYRHEGKYSDATWNRFFGTFQEFRRQAGLELSRHQHQHEKNIAKHASLDHYPEWYAEQVDPVTWLYPRAERHRVNTVAVISDNHDLKQDPFVWRVWLETVRAMQPDVICFNGDQNDCYEFNRYGIDPRQADAVKALTATREMFRQTREACPDSEIIWNLGNHEWRIMKHMADASPYLRTVLADFVGLNWADIFGVRDLGININCKWNLKAFTKPDVADQVQNNYVVLWETFALKHIYEPNFSISGTSGHTHRPETRTYANLSRGRRTPLNWTVTGSGCRGNAEYAEGLDRTSQGFALFHVMPDSGVTVPENVIIQGDFAAVGGKYFYRMDSES